MLIALFFDFLKGLCSSFDAIGMQARKRSQKPYFEQCGRCLPSKRHVRLVQFQLHKQNDTTGKSHALYENVRGFPFYTSKKQHVCSFGLTHWNLECPTLSIILPLLLNLKISYSEYVYDGWSGVWLSRKTFLTGNKNCEAEVFTRSWNLGKWSAVGGIDGTMDLMG